MITDMENFLAEDMGQGVFGPTRSKFVQFGFDSILRFALEASADMILFSLVSIQELEKSEFIASVKASIRISYLSVALYLV